MLEIIMHIAINKVDVILILLPNYIIIVKMEVS